MEAVVIHAPHDLRIETVPTPAVGTGEVRVRVRAGGICGSDLHYYHHGGFGTVRIKHPMVLGHEVSGVVEEVGAGVTAVVPGDRIAISPSRPCGLCKYCQRGLQNHCMDMRYFGSAMRTPHVQGAFRQEIVIDVGQAHRVSDRLTDAEAAMAEPLSVGLHAVRRAGPLVGRRVLVTGCGPIGAMIIAAARRAGAAHIVATDISPVALATALKSGADEALDVAADAAALAPYAVDKGTFDVHFEASGTERALRGALDALRPRAVIVQVGLGGEMNLPVSTLVTKELDLRGAFRFHEEFAVAVEMLGKGLIDVSSVITASFPHKDAAAAFELASDRSRAMKVMLTFA